jgi:hypothetical protein
VDRRAPHFDRDTRIQLGHSRLERLQGSIFVGEYSEFWCAGVFRNPETDAAREGFFVWAEPGVALGLSEDVVEERVEPIGTMVSMGEDDKYRGLAYRRAALRPALQRREGEVVDVE